MKAPVTIEMRISTGIAHESTLMISSCINIRAPVIENVVIINTISPIRIQKSSAIRYEINQVCCILFVVLLIHIKIQPSF